MPTHHPPLSPRCDPQYLDKVRTTAEMIAAANIHTFPVAAKWLKHYLSGANGVVNADLNWLRRNMQFSHALEHVRLALEYELIRAVLANVAGKLTNRQINRIGKNPTHDEPVRAAGPSDLFFASHRSTLRVTPKFVLWQSTGMPTIGGQAELKWWDKYDWNPNDPYSSLAVTKPLIPLKAPLNAIDYRDLDALQFCVQGGAKNFLVETKWIAKAHLQLGMTKFVKWLRQLNPTQFQIENKLAYEIQTKKLIRWNGI